ncbi:MAG TPA: Ig-like domain repeat protein [Candidatus Acidoferrales bacterium]|nr:Ig-like domain repeat protein [Candidatus Acidoferrales bacterium]
MSRKLLAVPCIFCTLLLVLFVSEIVFAQSAWQSLGNSANNIPLITQAVDESNLVVLHGNTHPLALPQYDRGAVSPDFALHRMLLVLKRSPAQEAALDQLLDQQQDNSSPSYHQWLTPQQFGQQFGPTDQDIQTITSWLASHGFQVANVSNGRVVIEFSGTAAQVAEAFHTTIHKYSVDGEQHIANSTDPQIPAALAPAIAGIRSLNNFAPTPMNHFAGKFQRDKNTGKLVPMGPLPYPQYLAGTGCGFLGGPCEALGPYDLATIYNISPLWNQASAIDGTGVTIAVVGETDINPADWTAFWNMFGVTTPKGTLNIVHAGADPGILQDGEEGEADIDTQWSSAVAKGATIDFVVSQSTETTFGTELSAEYIVDNNLAPVMSLSYGICELGLGTAGNAYYNAIWQQASAQGISVFLAAGDSGSATCDRGDVGTQFGLAVSGYASTPYNVAVGGTDFNDLTTTASYWNPTNNSTNQSNAKSYIPEETWNGTCTNSETFSYFGQTTAEGNCNFLYRNGVPAALIPAAGGGGASNCTNSNGQTPSSCSGGYAKPSWQTGPGVPSDGKRDLPDVSLFASNGFNNSFYLVCESDQTGGDCNLPNGEWLGFGGTSVSSPAFAGIMALVIQKNGGERQGNPNYVFYKMAAGTGNSCNTNSPTTSCIFYDIPYGSTIAMACVTSSPNCSTSTGGDSFGVLSGFATAAGYDEATGLGTVNVANLVNNWSTYAGQFKATKFSGFSLTPSPVTHGQAVTVAATVVSQTGSGTPTGTITLIANAGSANQQAAQQVFTLNSSGSLPSGTTTIFLPGGASESITAHYSGDSTYAPSDSSPFTVTVNPEPSKSSVQVETYNASTGQITNSNAANYVYGTPTILRANVGNSSGNPCTSNDLQQYGCPTGSVTLNDTFNPGTGNQNVVIAGSPYVLNSEGYTEDQSLFLLGGTHSIVASYSGDNSFLNSTGAGSSATPDAITVTPAPTTISLSIFGSGQALNTFNFNAIVSSQVALPPSPPPNFLPTQNVLFFDGTTPLNGQITYSTTSSPFGQLTATISALLPIGNNTITAQFPGDSNYVASGTSNPVTLDVQIPTTMIVSTSNPSIQVGTTVTFTAQVTPSQTFSQPMTGTITFTDASGTMGTVNIANGQAQLTTSSLNDSDALITAFYSGDTNYAETYAEVGQTVFAINTTTAVTASSTSIQQGASVTFTATITPARSFNPGPTGSIVFAANGSTMGTVPVSNNSAAFTTNSLPVGTDTITASYQGDPNYYLSQGTLTETVTGVPTFAISANPSPMVVSTPGASGSSTLTFTSMNGYAGSIPLSATLFSGLPSETTCSFNAMSVTLTASGAGSTGTVTATCQTTAPSSGAVPPEAGKRPSGPGWWLPFGFAALIAGVLALALFPIGTERRAERPRRWRVAFALFALAAFVAMSSCGGGSSGPPPPPPNPGTPIGLDNNVMLTFSNSGVTPSPTLNLPINVE